MTGRLVAIAKTGVEDKRQRERINGRGRGQTAEGEDERKRKRTRKEGEDKKRGGGNMRDGEGAEHKKGRRQCSTRSNHSWKGVIDHGQSGRL